MDYFLVVDNEHPRKLPVFQFTAGKDVTFQIPFAVHPQTITRKSPDLFHMEKPHFMKSVGQFVVMDENAVIYECVGDYVATEGNKVMVAGIVMRQTPAQDRDAALKAIAEAKTQIALQQAHARDSAMRLSHGSPSPGAAASA